MGHDNRNYALLQTPKSGLYAVRLENGIHSEIIEAVGPIPPEEVFDTQGNMADHWLNVVKRWLECHQATAAETAQWINAGADKSP